jgi:hypothetical protein
MKLTKSEENQFTKWLLNKGYSLSYARAVPRFHLTSKAKHAETERAKALLDAWIGENTAILHPKGNRKKKQTVGVGKTTVAVVQPTPQPAPPVQEKEEIEANTENALTRAILKAGLTDSKKIELLNKLFE